jgi:hypothetical protein
LNLLNRNEIIEIKDDTNELKLNKKTHSLRNNSKKLDIKRLKSNLKEEETKLILLKRLYYSQKYPNQAASVPLVASTNQQQQATNTIKINQQQLIKNKVSNLNARTYTQQIK